MSDLPAAKRRVVQEKRLRVVVPAEVLAKVSAGDRDFGVHRIRDDTNFPALRRNIILKHLMLNAVGKIHVSEDAATMQTAAEVHSPGYVNFLMNVWEAMSKKTKDDQEGWRQEFEENGESEVGYGAWTFCKTAEPRSDSWESQLVAYSCDEGPIFETTAQELRSDLGVVESAVEVLLQNSGYAYGMCTHPGHHAGPAYLAGYCFMNNAAIAANLLTKRGRRVGIVDVDVHGGNGTFDFIVEKKLPGVKFVSLHSRNGYPYANMKHLGRDLDPSKTSWEVYERELKAVLDQWADEIDTIVISLGWDTYVKDPLGGFKQGLYIEDYAKMASVFKSTGKDLLFLQEGGYALWDIAKISLSLFGILDGKTKPVGDYTFDSKFNIPKPEQTEKSAVPEVVEAKPSESSNLLLPTICADGELK